MKIYLVIIIILLIIASAIVAFCYYQQSIIGIYTSTDNGVSANNSTTTAIIPVNNSTNSSLSIPSNELMVKAVNWSDYPLIRFDSISKATIEGPNSIINHTFIDVHIKANIVNPDNVPEIYKEMSSIVKAEKAIIGPDSSVEIFCYVEGQIFNAWMLPYSNIISRRDYVHPVHNLTFSDIDASEVD